uniref:Ribosomal protein L5 n=1 Tax=Nitzschia sp. (in: diatoms) TaxID=1884248 RepID=A0A2U9GIU6_9STRA|nr:ribosomal protein L5 [Nitzschia sp. (in: diatoms)]AWQ64284.1 ribosomal protein L5 [Nitzschia sp. (in: diatoms)]
MISSNKFKKKHTIKIPKSIKLLYCDKKNILTFIGSSQTKSLKLKVKIFLEPMLNLITVTNIPVSGASTTDFKNAKKVQGTTVAKIKQILTEITYTLYHKLNLVGVGYRVFPYESLDNQLYFKLGYSHLIYFNVPGDLNTHCQKFTKLFLYGNCSFDSLTQTAAQIRACKFPEPYKGKGILHDQETITLKKGKKI